MIKQLLKKLLCNHDLKFHKGIDHYALGEDEGVDSRTDIFKCTKCPKFKKLRY